MKKKLMHVPLIMAGLLISTAGLAVERNNVDEGISAYVGVGAGYYRINDNDFLDDDDELKDNRHALRIYAGVEASRIFGIEAAYTDFGSTSDGPADMELTGWSLATLINIPVSEVVMPYGKIGVMSWDRERSVGSVSSSDDGRDLFYGLGARFTLMDNVDMRLEYERYSIDDTDIDMASVNLQFGF